MIGVTRINPYSKLDRQFVIGELKRTGSTDPDVLYSAKRHLLSSSNTSFIMGWVAVVLTILLCVSIILIIFAPLPLLFSIFIFMRSSENKKTINSAFDEYMEQIAAKTE